MRILILGAGGIGGYLGARLTEAGVDATLLVRPERREILQRDGLRLESVYGNFAGPVSTVLAEELEPGFDLVILTCKAYDLDAAIDAVAPGVGPDTTLLPILNGIAHIDRLNDAFGADRVLAGTVQISVARMPDGLVRHMNDWRWLRFGEQAGGISERVSTIRDALDLPPGLEPVALDDAMQEMWEKFVHLASAAGMTCLMRANVGQIARSAEGAALFRRFLESTAEVARRAGHGPGEAFLERYRALFSDPGTAYATSMLRDIEAGNSTEGEHIIGFLLSSARKYGIDEPLFEAAYAHLRAYDERRSDGGL